MSALRMSTTMRERSGEQLSINPAPSSRLQSSM
jgi:hypothetical protein